MVYLTLRVAEWKPWNAVIRISQFPGLVSAFTATGMAPEESAGGSSSCFCASSSPSRKNSTRMRGGS